MSGWEKSVNSNLEQAKRSLKIQAFIKFLLIALISIVLSAFLHTLSTKYGYSQTIQFLKSLDKWQDIGILISWKVTELGLEWFSGYDSYDAVSLTLLSHGPPLYLLVTFYKVPVTAVLHYLLIDSFAAYVSFRIFRPLSFSRSFSRKVLSQLENGEILASVTVQAYTILLAASVYTITTFTAYRTNLPLYLVTNFENIQDISVVHSPFYITLLPATILAGLAAKTFIFTPAIAASGAKYNSFDARTASLWETLIFNLWGYSPETKVVIKRTIFLMVTSGVNTFLHTYLTIRGAKLAGSIAYTAFSIFASGITGIALGLVVVAA